MQYTECQMKFCNHLVGCSTFKVAWVFTVCLQNVLLKLNKNEKYHPTSLKNKWTVLIDNGGKFHGLNGLICLLGCAPYQIERCDLSVEFFFSLSSRQI